MRKVVTILAVLAVGGSACRNATERFCRQAADERNRNDPAHAFPVEDFMRACRRLSPADAQCTIPSFAGSYAVLSSRGCTAAYNNPDFPRDIILGTRPASTDRAH